MENMNSTNKGMNDTELNPSMQKAAEAATELKDEVKQEIGKYADTAKEYWDEFSDEVRAKAQIAREGLTKAKKYADDTVHENPWRAIGLAAVIGAVAGIVISSCNRSKRCRHQQHDHD